MTQHETILHNYLREVENYYRLAIVEEHGYRSALQALLPRLVPGITAVNEPKRAACGAPDYAVLRLSGGNPFTIGYIEARDIGIPLDSIEKDEQMGRYLRGLDNLILTDYLEFRWYVRGEKQMTARLAIPHGGKSLRVAKQAIAAADDLLCSFLHYNAEPIRKPEELAKRMARLAHMIRAITVTAFEKREASATLTALYEAFKTVLLSDLPPTQFADMFAQTLAIGLFAARYNHRGPEPFNRCAAATEIPRTNPFLRKLFSTMAGADFEDEPFIGFVHELAQALGMTDMEAVLADFGKHTRREDPIVHFYETFLSQYDPRLRELRGVYYTPEPVVSYMVHSVDYLLREHFDCPDGLADTSTVSYTYTDENLNTRSRRSPRVLLLDPACGTGTFLYAIIDKIRETYRKSGNAGMWSAYVREHLLTRLFGFELLMAPYAVAHLKLGMQLAALDLPEGERADWAYDFKTDERLCLYLTNTLEQVLGRSRLLLGSFISDEANQAAKVKQDYPVMVVIGNPPYSGHSANKGEWISNLLHGDDGRSATKNGNYFEVDGKPLGERNPKWLNDDYVKFIRFAQWCIEQTGYGILAFISNHGYLDNPTFRGMRQSLVQSFDEIYVLDLHGNSKKKEKAPDGTRDENVFDIQQGVAVGIFVKGHRKAGTSSGTIVRHANLWGPREVFQKAGQNQQLIGGKYHWFAEHTIPTTEWTILVPEAPLYLFVPQEIDLRTEYERGWRVHEIFPRTLLGPNSHRDHFAIAFTYDDAAGRIDDFVNLSLSDEDLKRMYALQDNRDWSLKQARQCDLHGIVPVKCIYRPFDFRFMLYGSFAFDYPRSEINDQLLEKNLALISTRQTKETFSVLVTDEPAGQHKLATPYDGSYLSPLYIYREATQNALFDFDKLTRGRRPNLSPAFLTDIVSKLDMQFISDGKGDLQRTFGPEDIFDYLYAIFYSPTYRTRYAEFLRTDFPRLPLTSNPELFRELCKLGERLVGLHVMEMSGQALSCYPVRGNDQVEKVEYLEPGDAPEQGRVFINKTQYFEGVPPEVWNFHVGGYQVCQKWLKDRKGRILSFEDIQHYRRVVAALAGTIALMEAVDEAVEEHGGWPVG